MEHAMWEDDNAAVFAQQGMGKNTTGVSENGVKRQYIYIYTIWLFNIAMENHHF